MSDPYATKRFLIKFGDNDFGNTLLAFGNLIIRSRENNPFQYEWLTKRQIADLWNMSAGPIYLIAQNGGRYASNLGHTHQYLQISYADVYLDQEATDYIDNNQGRWNSSWVLVDFETGYSVLV